MSLSIVFCNAFAQLSIQPLLPLAGLVQKNNLWNITVINTSATNYECRIDLTLRDRASGLEVLTATTGLFQVGAGAKQLNAANLLPLQYNYISSSVTARNNDFIPVGDYTACYRLIENGKNILAEDCESFDVEPLSPPMLISPADSSQLNVEPSQFIWVPPAPMNLFNRLQYEVVVAEILPGQKPEEAIQQNLPFYTEPNIPINNLTYKGMASSFEKDKWYAWQVVAKDENAYAGKSEVWIFKLNTLGRENIPVPNNIYLLIQDHITGPYDITGNKVYIKYFSAKEYTGVVFFKNERGNIMKRIRQRIVQGENYFDFNLDNHFRKGKVYSLTITDQNNKEQTITFSIKK